MTTQAYEDLLRATKEAYAFYLAVCSETQLDIAKIPCAEIFFILGGNLADAIREAIGPFRDGDILNEVMMQYDAEQRAANL